MVEHATVNRVVVGSSPTSGATRPLSDSPLKSGRGTAPETPLQSQTVCKSVCRFRAEPQFARTPPLLPHYSVTGRKSELLSSSDGENAEKIPALPTRRRRLLLAGKRHRKSRKPQNKEPRRGGGTHAGKKRGAAPASPWLHLGGDSVCQHIAAAFRTPAVVIFGSTPTSVFGHPTATNLSAGPASCHPCFIEDRFADGHRRAQKCALGGCAGRVYADELIARAIHRLNL